MKNTLYIVIPCYNEEAVLPQTAPLFKKELKDMIDSGPISEESQIMFDNKASIYTRVHDKKVMDRIPTQIARDQYAKQTVVAHYKEPSPNRIVYMWIEKMGLSFGDGTTCLSERCAMGNVGSTFENILFGRFSPVYELYCFSLHMTLIGILLVCLYMLYTSENQSSSCRSPS
jgi:hypothetical protein